MIPHSPDLSHEVPTTEPVALCGHEECGTLYHPEIGHVTDCLWGPALLEVSA